MKRALGMLGILLAGMVALSQNVPPTKARTADEPAVYSTSSVKFDFAKNRLEWEMLRAPRPGGTTQGQVESFYIDLERNVMGHDGKETPVNERVWVNLGKLFHGLDNLAIRHTKNWFEQKQEQKDGEKQVVAGKEVEI
ncbi:MAG: hypothetical protein HY648_01165 [Acidobacteria bacterium]|nr:hypothetical protein [Acidobacteriota bacterium]